MVLISEVKSRACTTATESIPGAGAGAGIGAAKTAVMAVKAAKTPKKRMVMMMMPWGFKDR
jgi:glycerate kinase